MKKWIIPVVIIVALVAIIAFWAVGIKNTALTRNQAVEKTWGDVETSYQRRNDLIGNLVKTVEGAANFEKGTFTAVTEARSRANSIQVDPSNATPEQLQAYAAAQNNVQSSFRSLLGNITVEAYPQLRSNENFLKLQDELASTENTIQTARTRYNESVEAYNNYVLRFPNSLFLGQYKERPYFRSVDGAEKPVDVNFDIK
jgi:LemA protein